MRNKQVLLLSFILFLVPLTALGQESVLVIPSQYPAGRLNTIIAADTAGAGAAAWQAGTRVYALQRGGIFPQDQTIQLGNDRKLKIRAAYNSEIEPVFDSTYDPMIWGYDTPGTTGRPPGTLFILGGTNNVLDLKHISISGFDEGNTGEVDGVQANLINIITAGGDGKGRIIIDSCLLKSSNGNHIRTDGAPSTVRVTHTLFADMGNLATSNLATGKGIDVRANKVDTLDVRNCTFVNSLNHLIRHYQATAPIMNLWFNNNTIVNGLSFDGLLCLGAVDNTGTGVLQIKNNMLIDNFALGNDTCAVRQLEFNDSGENDPVNGKPRMTWITAKPNLMANWDIGNNYYTVSDSGAFMFNQFAYYQDEATPLTWGINARLAALGRDTLNAFRKIALQPTNVPDLMTRMIRWFYRPYAQGGAGKRILSYDPNYPQIGPGNWTYDYNRRSIWYYLDTLDCDFRAEISLPGIGDPRWSQQPGMPTGTLLTMIAGWNLVSNPRIQVNCSQVFQGSFGDWFGYDGAIGYFPSPTCMELGRGYWVYFPSTMAINIHGVAPSRKITIPVSAGWFLLGSRAWPVKIPLLIGPIFGDAFGYNSGSGMYEPKNVINPGEAVWVYVPTAGTITLP